MDPFLGGAIIGGVGNLIGGALGMAGQASANETNKEMQDRANQMNVVNAKTQMDFQERMSSTAYQRAMADMQKAGLNPMLAFSQGGASSPGGSFAPAGAAKVENELGGWSDSLKGVSSTAFQASAMKKDFEQKDSQIGLTKAQDKNTKETTRLIGEQKNTEKTKQAANLATANEAAARAEALRAQQEAIAAEAKVRSKHAIIDADNITFDATTKRVVPLVNTGLKALETLTPRGGKKIPLELPNNYPPAKKNYKLWETE